MANTKPVELGRTFTLRADDAFHEALYAIRASRRPVPTKAELLRDLVQEELERTKTRRS